MMNGTAFHLNVTQIESVCRFELRGEGRTIAVNVNYPQSLMQKYERWREAYLNYYRQLRGRKVSSGGGSTPPIDSDNQLVNAEVDLLHEFHRWLLSPDLERIRSEIAKAKAASKHLEAGKHCCEVFLCCTPIELARLPWETWEIGTDLGDSGKIRIVRTPANVSSEPVRSLRRKVRILAILGDDTGLNFAADEEAVRSLRRVAEVKFIGWEADKEKTEVNCGTLKTRIAQAIANEDGWDVLFFAGHSNETVLGGEFGIAPGVSLSIHEIEEALKIAKKRGLQFAIFNSCSGINIAESLINLGLSQVAVMREPIHNKVAQEFLLQFINSLAEYKDVHEALLDTSQYLKQQEKRLLYPSAYLVPSLFRHPDAELFRIKPFGLGSIVKQLLPSPKEAGWLIALLLLSLVPQVQSLLLEPRILLQAAYRKFTFQEPSKVEPPLVLVQIDNKSLTKDNIEQRYPIDYSYLASIIQKLSQSNAKLIGIDYLLDKDKEQQESAKESLIRHIKDARNKGTLFVFAYKEYENPKKGRVNNKLARLNGTWHGNIDFFEWYIELSTSSTQHNNYPFSYTLALAYSHQIQNLNSPDLLKDLNLKSLSDLSHLALLIPKNAQDNLTGFLSKLHLHPISNFAQWFHPIIDFSIPPDRAYTTISACELLGSCKQENTKIPDLNKKVVIIAPGGYEEAGVEGKGDDNFTTPLAVSFWRGWNQEKFTGGKAHAYMVHHFLTRRLVVPVPDFIMILLAALLGKYIAMRLLDNPSQRKLLVKTLRIALVVYVIVSLQLYISAALLLPWFLPSVTMWNYVRLPFRRNSHG
ncbi:CHASE2 domain-containing protein [Scytonema sp. UIC 10036]|uniref:CHASE2 domain-containing protein n=1 Tax=Scytonema sp. UIC 10036 TaxID=2304196 RepID=UPI0012DA4D68|nr:CHASE2 domain-containing protein [Scytonema sp. UIC 10036]MUG91336.1 CHASE2 domain-containing protein [Scytonema sp. UIC 10036]